MITPLLKEKEERQNLGWGPPGGGRAQLPVGSGWREVETGTRTGIPRLGFGWKKKREKKDLFQAKNRAHPACY